MTDNCPDRLPSVFERACDLHEALDHSTDSSNSNAYQSKLKEAVELFAQATMMVNSLALFSANEHIDEVATADIKYMLLPAFLGDLTLKTQMSDGVDRKQLVHHSKVYFRDYLVRCRCYQVAPADLRILGEDEEEPFPTQNKKSLDEMNKSRDAKIKRFQERRDIENKINIMKKIIKDHPDKQMDDQQMRTHYTNWLKLWVHISSEHMDSVHSEMEILEHMERMRNGTAPPQPPRPNLEPMKPFLITKDMTRQAIAKEVFGYGTKCLPTMTEDEYFEKEIREGKIVMDFDNANKAPEKEESDSDEDIDNAEKLQYKRDKDDWKDTNRRGDGNKDRHG